MTMEKFIGGNSRLAQEDAARLNRNLAILETASHAGVTASAAEINVLDNVTPGTGAASKALVLDAGEDLVFPATGVFTYGVLKDAAGTTLGATAAEINQACDVSAMSQLIAASGAITAGKKSVLLNHATVAIAATIADTANHYGLFFVKAGLEPGAGQDHTVTITTGTWNGTNKVATFADINDAVLVFFDSSGNGTVISNTGSVAFSG